MTNPPLRSPGQARAAYRSNQIVVDLEHLADVQAVLNRMNIKHEVDKYNDRLGLALLDLPGLSEPFERPDGRHLRAPTLDEVLGDVRTDFRNRYANWTPTMGKNRFLTGLEGLGEISGGGVRPLGDPGGPTTTQGEINGGGVRPLGDPGGPTTTQGEINGGGTSGPQPVDHRAELAADGSPGPRVTVGVLDTGMVAHPDLVGRFLTDSEVLPYTADAPRSFFTGHATFIAGRILSAAPRADLHVEKVLTGAGGSASAWDVACKIVEFADAGVQILNLSLGCTTDDGDPPLVLQRAVERLGPDVVVVAAAGNYPPVTGDQPVRPMYPAALAGVLAVGARHGEADERRPAPFSPELPWVQVMAAGVDVVSHYLHGPVTIDGRDDTGAPVTVATREFTGAARWSGSSFAAANVTGRIAAETVPGQVSARQALAKVLGSQPRPAYL